jgi:multiple antibiotic resistance protein
MLELQEYLKLLIGLLAIVNPVGVVPVFLSLTEGRPADERLKTGRITALAMTAILLVSLVLGETLLRSFGISIPSFQIAGGILILIMAISMLQGRLSQARHTPEEHQESVEKESVAVVPLAIPLLSGPGAIGTVIVYAHGSNTVGHYVTMVAVILTVGLIVLAGMRLAPAIARVMGRTGMNIVTRIMGLIIASIAVEFIAKGIWALFPGVR